MLFYLTMVNIFVDRRVKYVKREFASPVRKMLNARSTRSLSQIEIILNSVKFSSGSHFPSAIILFVRKKFSKHLFVAGYIEQMARRKWAGKILEEDSPSSGG